MANKDVSLSAAVRSNLLALATTTDLIERTQNRLSTGLRVASPTDDARAFFEAKALNDRAADMNDRKDGIDQAVSSVNAALEGINGIDTLLKQLKGLAISAKTATGAQLTSITTQYDQIKTQIDNLADDTNYQGVNLINNTSAQLVVSFSTLSTSILTITASDLRTNTTTGLSVTSAVNFSLASVVDAAMLQLETAILTIRGKTQEIGSNVALLKTRLDFTKAYVNELEGGSGKLTLADINEEGANLVALQTRQQLGINSLAFAGQSEQAILQLFR